jgi:hypothetical protein
MRFFMEYSIPHNRPGLLRSLRVGSTDWAHQFGHRLAQALGNNNFPNIDLILHFGLTFYNSSNVCHVSTFTCEYSHDGLGLSIHYPLN